MLLPSCPVVVLAAAGKPLLLSLPLLPLLLLVGVPVFDTQGAFQPTDAPSLLLLLLLPLLAASTFSAAVSAIAEVGAATSLLLPGSAVVGGCANEGFCCHRL